MVKEEAKKEDKNYSKALNYLLNEVGIEMIVADHYISNPASGRVMEKAGMKYAYILPQWVINKNGKREDIKGYAKFKNNN